MLIKLVIIAGVVIFGVMLFSSEIQTFLPSTSSAVVDSFKTDVANLTLQASDSVEQRLDTTVDTVKNTTDNILSEQLNSAEILIADGITDVTDSTHSVIDDGLSNIPPLESLTSIFNSSSGP